MIWRLFQGLFCLHSQALRPALLLRPVSSFSSGSCPSPLEKYSRDSFKELLLNLFFCSLLSANNPGKQQLTTLNLRSGCRLVLVTILNRALFKYCIVPSVFFPGNITIVSSSLNVWRLLQTRHFQTGTCPCIERQSCCTNKNFLAPLMAYKFRSS